MKTLIKTLLLFALVLTELSFSSAMANPISENNLPSETNLLMRPFLDISIIFGRQSRDCEGWGICKMTIGIDLGDLRQNNGNGQLYLDEAAKSTLVIQINKSKGVSNACYNTYLKSGTFTIDEEFNLPLEISKKLDMMGQKIIPAGKYRIEEVRGIIYIRIPMK